MLSANQRKTLPQDRRTFPEAQGQIMEKTRISSNLSKMMIMAKAKAMAKAMAKAIGQGQWPRPLAKAISQGH